MNEKVVKLFENKSFLEKILKMDDEADIAEAFRQEGVELTKEEMMELKETVAKFGERLEGMSESDLENVSAGLVGWLGTALTWGSTAISVGSSIKSVGGSIKGVMDNSKRVKMGEAELENSKILAEKAEKNSKEVVAKSLAVATLAGALCYFKKDIGKFWKSAKNKFTK